MKKGIGLVFLVMCLILPNFCHAQNYSLDTVKIYKDIQPGKSYEEFITVSFLGHDPTQAADIDVVMSDWIYDDISQAVSARPANTQPNSCVPWINVSPSSFSIDGTNKKVQVLCSITVPSELEHPEYNAILFFSTKPDLDEKDAQMNVTVETRLAVLVKLIDRNKAVLSGEIKSFDVKKNDEEDAYDLLIGTKNTGNILLFIEGDFNVIDAEGNLYGRGQITRTPISPGISQTVLHTWYGELESGEYDVVSTIEMGSTENIEVLETHIVVE